MTDENGWTPPKTLQVAQLEAFEEKEINFRVFKVVSTSRKVKKNIIWCFLGLKFKTQGPLLVPVRSTAKPLLTHTSQWKPKAMGYGLGLLQIEFAIKN